MSKSVPTMSFDALVEVLRSAGLGPNCVVHENVDSTNRLARRVAESIYAGDGTPRPTWFIGFEQTAGRGRHERHWRSTAGSGIYASLLLPIAGPTDPDRLLSLPLAVGLAACRAMRLCSGTEEIGLKWPNDLVLRGRKLGGILIEVVEGGAEHRCAMIGIGVNHQQGPEQLPHENATSLRILASRHNRSLRSLGECTLALCASVYEEVVQERPLKHILSDYENYSVHTPGDKLTWTSSDGPVEGVFEGFDAQGCILLRTKTGRVKVSAGDIYLDGRIDQGDDPTAQKS